MRNSATISLLEKASTMATETYRFLLMNRLRGMTNLGRSLRSLALMTTVRKYWAEKRPKSVA